MGLRYVPVPYPRRLPRMHYIPVFDGQDFIMGDLRSQVEVAWWTVFKVGE